MRLNLLYFRDHLIAASLKPATAGPGQPYPTDFRDHLIAASLKPVDSADTRLAG